MGYDRCVEQQFGEVRGICESQVGRDRLEFVHQVNKDFNPGSQVQDAADLLFRFERLADSLILPRTLQAALIFECKTHSLIAQPNINDRVIILLIRGTGNVVKGRNFHIRMPAGKQVLTSQSELNAIEFEGMKDLGNVWKMLRPGM